MARTVRSTDGICALIWDRWCPVSKGCPREEGDELVLMSRYCREEVVDRKEEVFFKQYSL